MFFLFKKNRERKKIFFTFVLLFFLFTIQNSLGSLDFFARPYSIKKILKVLSIAATLYGVYRVKAALYKWGHFFRITHKKKREGKVFQENIRDITVKKSFLSLTRYICSEVGLNQFLAKECSFSEAYTYECLEKVLAALSSVLEQNLVRIFRGDTHQILLLGRGKKLLERADILKNPQVKKELLNSSSILEKFMQKMKERLRIGRESNEREKAIKPLKLPYLQPKKYPKDKIKSRDDRGNKEDREQFLSWLVQWHAKMLPTKESDKYFNFRRVLGGHRREIRDEQAEKELVQTTSVEAIKWFSKILIKIFTKRAIYIKPLDEYSEVEELKASIAKGTTLMITTGWGYYGIIHLSNLLSLKIGSVSLLAIYSFFTLCHALKQRSNPLFAYTLIKTFEFF